MESEKQNPPKWALSFPLIVLLFVISGAAGLIDQFCFSKYLSYIVGSTAYAVSAVLAAFMTGMALGAYLAGKYATRVQRPLAAYGLLELCVAIAVALTPTLFEVVTPIYLSIVDASDSLASASAARWGLAFVVVLIPTTAMGATLPLLSRLVETGPPLETGARQRRLGALYAANTLGGALGALGGAYLIVPALGLRHSLYFSAGLSGLVFVVAVLLPTSRARSAADSASPPIPKNDDVPGLRPLPVREARLLGVLAFGSGALVFCAEVIFTHLLALTVGNSAFAFGLILAVFLVCLFGGASIAPWLHRRLPQAALPIGLALSATLLALTLPWWGSVADAFEGQGARYPTFFDRELLRGTTAFSILVLPTLAMGLTFPLTLQRIAHHPDVGGRVGRLVAINTAGAVVGSLVAGYVLLDALGSQRALQLLVACFVVFAAAALPRSGATGRGAAIVIAVVGLVTIQWQDRWDLARMTSGTNVYFDGVTPPDRIVHVQEDVHGGVTTVTETDGVRTLLTNGKFQGNNGLEMSAQRFFAHYPSLFVKRYDRALAIGLGTGTTVGTMAAYPWNQIDVVEISPSIVYASKTYFADANRGALSDPRVSLTIADGRNFLATADVHYDLIGIELTSIWFAGAASLYSREFYRLVAERLSPGGVFQQWVQLHHMHDIDFVTLLNTLRAEFPHIALFYGGGQGILVSSKQPLIASGASVQALQDRSDLADVLPTDRSLRSLIHDILICEESVDEYLDASAATAGRSRESLVSTDDNLYLEYATPRGNVLPWGHREELISRIASFRDPQRISNRIVD